MVMFFQFSRKIGELEIKVNTMWEFQLRRALSEVVEKRMGTINSPLKLEEDVTKSLAPLKPELEKFWKTEGQKLSDAEALLKIENKFGDQLLRLICIPQGLTHGACLIVALAVAKSTNVLDLHFSAHNIYR